MRPLIQQLVDQGPGEQATVLVVGAGDGADLPLLRRLGASRLILAEAHPGQAEVLSRRIDPAQGEEVWSLAITAKPMEQALLRIVNNPAFSSLKAPTGLVEHFPNLREVQQADVSARSLAEAIETLVLDRSAGHVLVFDAPGQAFEVLSATPSQALQVFAEVVVRGSLEPLYDGDKELDEVVAVLRKSGFDPGNEDPEAIFPQAAILLTRNDARADKLRLEALLEEVKVDLEKQSGLAEQHAQEIERLTHDRDRAVALARQHEAELEKVNLVASELRELTASHEAQSKQLIQERDAQASLATERGAALEKANQVVAERQKLVADRDAQVGKIAQERDAQASLATERGAALEKANQVAAERQKLVADRDAQVGKLTQERDAQARLAAERNAALEKANQLVAERQKMVASQDARIEELTKERDGQAKLVVEKQALLDKAISQNQARGARIIELEREQARLDQHQAWLDEEVVKAEAQVDLIKDLLLREKAV